MMPILVKMMTSEVEERPRLVMGGYRRHRSQWVNFGCKGIQDAHNELNELHEAFQGIKVTSNTILKTKDTGISNQ